MNTSGEAAEQVVRMSLEGVEIVLKIAGAGAKNIAAMIYGTPSYKRYGCLSPSPPRASRAVGYGM